MTTPVQGMPTIPRYRDSGHVSSGMVISISPPPVQQTQDLRGQNTTPTFVFNVGVSADPWAAAVARVEQACQQAASVVFPAEWQAGAVAITRAPALFANDLVKAYVVVTVPASSAANLIGGAERVFYEDIRRRLGSAYPTQVGVILQSA